MRRRVLLPLMFVVLVALLGCGGRTPSPETSPISPLRLPEVSRGPLRPEGWLSGDVGPVHAQYIEIQVYQPLAWTDIDWDGERIWLVDNVVQRLVGLDRTGREVESLPFPQIDDVPCNITGIATADGRIWIADVHHRQVYAMDRGSGEIIGGFPVEGTTQAIDWDGQTLWIVMAESNRLERRDEEGNLLASYPLRGEWVTAIAWDGARIWYVDSVNQQGWTFNPAGRWHKRRPVLDHFINQVSYSGLAWADDYLLLFDDMGGRLYALPKEVVTR